MENNNTKTVKKIYVTPEVTVHGDIEVITQANATGRSFDGRFTHLQS